MRTKKIISLWLVVITVLLSCSIQGIAVSASEYSIELSYENSDSGYSVKGTYNYPKSREEALTAILAVYDSNGLLKAVKTKDVLTEDSSTVIDGITAQKSYVIKGMLWKKANMQPVTDAVVKTVEEIETPTATPTVTPTAPPTATPTDVPAKSVVWDFAEFAGENALNASENTEKGYTVSGLTLDMHLASGDSVTDGGLYWSAPSGTKSDATTTVKNNRYIIFVPPHNGTMTITYKGANNANNKHPRMYLSCGNSLDCTTKDESASQLEPNQSYDNNSTDFKTAEFKLSGGKQYYIWSYYYNSNSNQFTISNITFEKTKSAVRTRNIYGSNMLLQRDKPIVIDGKCEAVSEVSVTLQRESDGQVIQKEKAEPVKNGGHEEDDWSVTLDAVSDYTDTYKLTVSADNADSVEYTNIIFGDQYLFSGQSNMWKQVSYYKNIDKEAYGTDAAAKHSTDKIRVMLTPGSGDTGSTELCYDAKNAQAWRDFSTYDNVKEISAAAYTAAVKMHEETGVPIGVISNAYPGSYISSWFPSSLKIDPPNEGLNKGDNQRNWYNGRIYPIRNLKLSGIFWYQGEADAATTYAEYHKEYSSQYEYYKAMLPRLIEDWRELFGEEKLPFYYVQLCRIGSTVVDENNPDTGTAGKLQIKNAQTDVYLEMEDKTNVGVIGTLDIYGRYEFPNTTNDANCRNDIHPGQKQVVGERLAAYALKDIYNKDVYSHGPIYKSSEVSGDKIIVTFDCSGQLKVMPKEQYTDEVGAKKIEEGEINPAVLNEFEIAGEDGEWHEATAVITGTDKVTVSSQAVSNPVKVRYAAGADYPESPNLTDDSNMPSYVFSKTADKDITEPTDSPSPTPSAAPGISEIYKFDFGGSTPEDGYIFGKI